MRFGPAKWDRDWQTGPPAVGCEPAEVDRLKARVPFD